MTLDEIALKHGTDKASNVHGYTKYYEMFFEPIRMNSLTLFEAGFGSYGYTDQGGHSARTWREYFPNATIVATDIYHKTIIPNGVHFYQGSQDDKEFWKRVINDVGYHPDIFIDDASHRNDLSVKTFEVMFPMLATGGIFVIEDLEPSWWQDIASDGTDFKGCKDPLDFYAPTTINFIRKLINDINAKKIHGYVEQYPIESIHLYHNIAFIIKK